MSDALPLQASTASLAAVNAAKAAIAKSQLASERETSSSASSSDDGEVVNVPMPGEIETLSAGLVDKTVFEDPAHFTVKHPLHSTWQLWFDSASKQDKAKSWDDALMKVIDFDSVEEFWGYAVPFFEYFQRKLLTSFDVLPDSTTTSFHLL